MIATNSLNSNIKLKVTRSIATNLKPNQKCGNYFIHNHLIDPTRGEFSAINNHIREVD